MIKNKRKSNNMVNLTFLFFLLFCIVAPQTVKTETPMKTETIQFERNNQFTIKIDVPNNWRLVRERRGTPVPGTTQTYDLRIVSPSREKALLTITIGKTQTGQSFSQQQFDTLINGRVSLLLPHAVEERAAYNEIQLNGGHGKYCILTDASLVNKTNIPNDEYLYLGIYFANYNNGYIVYATALADDINSEIFQLMLRSLLSIEPLSVE